MAPPKVRNWWWKFLWTKHGWTQQLRVECPCHAQQWLQMSPQSQIWYTEKEELSPAQSYWPPAVPNCSPDSFPSKCYRNTGSVLIYTMLTHSFDYHSQMLQCHLLLVCMSVCVCVLPSVIIHENPSMSEFIPFALRLLKYRWEMRQWQNGDPDWESRVVWKADKFHQKHNVESVQERWRTVISWRGETDRKKGCVCHDGMLRWSLQLFDNCLFHSLAALFWSCQC